ncbi:helix-turn-helix domain containing protein [Marinobacter sp. M3C]|uniref:helix-turn-helix domain-containing protein n=1 Tax=unclassified Marinobacter TaxID=83889 RepID=UPI00200CC478|nr:MULTISPECIES: helix-turn-helix domain-containing protein [unclassified Marinobacter]MCL1479059.1 helix-turn-helix domain containing protein [Marinobacter sp.]MCL1488973.1 helix-turn-helix domain containing protein [Marinobacter sp.]UQG57137.1 helix-turn-helix domain containing protein [Marinobacter sp. M4C]UQG61681.1 helix-turn-helix domain containing protein [Marinobacter sp. M3C]UQG65941.1 helix-turn-helix domain containing protein [Marinobacter sp. M2C]
MKSMSSEVDIVLSRMKKIFGVERDADLARALAISPQTLSSWRQRAAVPYALCVECAKTKGASLDWLLYGEGQMMRDNSASPAAFNHNVTDEDSVIRMQIYEILETLSHEDLEDILSEAAHRQRLRALEHRFETLQAQFFYNQESDGSVPGKKTA